MNVNNVSLEAVGVKNEQYPTTGYPEIAFVGRSNVGKSTLINAMINRKALARTSQTPGKTRTINFYNIEDKLYFVDLPGYGYAKTSKTESQKWGAMIEEYLLKRETLKAVIMLVDIRHEPMEIDKIMLDFLRHYEYELMLAATKADKLTRNQLNKQLSVLRNGFGLNDREIIIPFSGVTKQGKDELWKKIDNLILAD